MKTLSLLLVLLAPGLLGAVPAAQSVPDDTYWTDGNGTTVHVDVTDTPGPGVSVTFTDATGFTGAISGTPGSDSTETKPTCDDSGVGTTNAPTGTSNTYNIEPDTSTNDPDDSVVQKKNAAGEWVNMRQVKKKKAGAGSIGWGGSHGAQELQQGQVAPWKGRLVSHDGTKAMLLEAGDAAPFAGMLVPGDEVTSLPT